MKAAILLTVAGITSLLIANELQYSAQDVLSQRYEGISGVLDFTQYMYLHTGFVLIAVASLLCAIGLFILESKSSK